MHTFRLYVAAKRLLLLTALLCLALTWITEEQLFCCPSLYTTLTYKHQSQWMHTFINNYQPNLLAGAILCTVSLKALTTYFGTKASCAISNPHLESHRSFCFTGLIQNWGHLGICGFIHATEHGRMLSESPILFLFFVHSLQYLNTCVHLCTPNNLLLSK